MQQELIIGCHLSSGKGYEAMAKTAQSIDANTFAFFTRNPRGGAAKAIDPEDIKRFEEACKEAGIGEGQIGAEALVRVLEHPALQGLPAILETPNELPGYAKEISFFREAVGQ